ncbi:MAG: Dps family protein [Phycisphaerales bacterium JB059]
MSAQTSTIETSKATADSLNRLLSDATVFWYKLHNDHWNITGHQFFTLHEKYEELYTRWAEIVDELAERVLTVGHRPVGTLREALEQSEIQERTQDLSGVDRVKSTLDDLRLMHERMGQAIEVASSAGDRGTENLLDEIRDTMEKNMWMLRAFATA